MMAINQENDQTYGTRTHFVMLNDELSLGNLMSEVVFRHDLRNSKLLNHNIKKGKENKYLHKLWILLSFVAMYCLKYILPPVFKFGKKIEELLNNNIKDEESPRYKSIIGHLDTRTELDKGIKQEDGRYLPSLTMMASKLAYENEAFVKQVVSDQWKMKFEGFYTMYNEFQEAQETQAFIFRDTTTGKSEKVIVAFRGTSAFSPVDWSTDIDLSWCKLDGMDGKLHRGFLTALGLRKTPKDPKSNEPEDLRKTLKDPNSNKLEDIRKTLKDPNSNTPEDIRKIPKDPNSNKPEDIRKTPKEPNSNNPEDTYHGHFPKHIDPKDDTSYGPLAYYKIRDELKRILKENSNAKIIVTGHSLGGALAILFPSILALHKEAYLLDRLEAIYTFGQPKVGDQKFVTYMSGKLKKLKVKYYRIVYSCDAVPNLPWDNAAMRFKHFGTCVRFNSLYQGEIDDGGEALGEKLVNLPKGFKWLMAWIMYVANAVWELIRGFIIQITAGEDYRESWTLIVSRILSIATPCLIAHNPQDYVNATRLASPHLFLN